jgi:hypothetical protein
MKTGKKFFFLALTLFVGVQVFAQDKATVYFIRSTGVGQTLASYRMFIDDALVCKLKNKQFSIHEVEPGFRAIAVQSDIKYPPTKIEVKAGETYYVSIVLKSDGFGFSASCVEITENAAKIEMQGTGRREKCL